MSGKNRDDFSDATKTRLAAEVGYRCSLPDCGAPTIGPSGTEPRGYSNSGVAAHITAASGLGPRRDDSLSPDERSSHENGIWCCAKHGRIVDNDPATYTVAQLRAWKADAIDLQRRAHSTGDIDPNGRVKLARANRDAIATRAVKAAIRCANAIMAGVQLSDSAKRVRQIQSREVTLVQARLHTWTDEMKHAIGDINDAMIDIRVGWGIGDGEPAGLQSLVLLTAWLEECRMSFTNFLEVVSTSGRPRSNSGSYDWFAIFNGAQDKRALLADELNRTTGLVEEWADPYIVSRQS